MKNYSMKKSAKELSLVDFYADWCGPCRMLAPVLEEVAKELVDITILKVNVDQMRFISGRFNIRSIPTVMLFKDGKQVATNTGFVSKPTLMRFIKQ